MARNPAVNRGAALVSEIQHTSVNPGHVGIWWLGQATFCLKLGPTVIYIDPFFRDENQPPPAMQEFPLRPQEFRHASIICGTHEHLDHIDELTLPGAAAASSQARIAVPAATREKVLKMGVPAERLQPMRGDDSFEHAGVRVTAIPAAHQKLEHTPENGYRYLGYIFEGNGVTVYHPGDIQPYEGWTTRLLQRKLDVALLPISGVDNLHWQQAVYFCAIHRPKLAIPMHYGVFPKYTEDPQVFVHGLSLNVPQQAVRLLQVGEKFVFPA